MYLYLYTHPAHFTAMYEFSHTYPTEKAYAGGRHATPLCILAQGSLMIATSAESLT